MSCGNTFQRKHLFVKDVLPFVDKDNAFGQLEKHFPGMGICDEHSKCLA